MAPILLLLKCLFIVYAFFIFALKELLHKPTPWVVTGSVSSIAVSHALESVLSGIQSNVRVARASRFTYLVLIREATTGSCQELAGTKLRSLNVTRSQGDHFSFLGDIGQPQHSRSRPVACNLANGGLYAYRLSFFLFLELSVTKLMDVTDRQTL